jgi:hypothetical protein
MRHQLNDVTPATENTFVYNVQCITETDVLKDYMSIRITHMRLARSCREVTDSCRAIDLTVKSCRMSLRHPKAISMKLQPSLEVV